MVVSRSGTFISHKCAGRYSTTFITSNATGLSIYPARLADSQWWRGEAIGQRSAAGGWTVCGRQSVVSSHRSPDRWSVNSGQWMVVMGQRLLFSGQWSVVSSQ